MKKILGVSLGSSTRDHKVVVEVLGEKVEIERRGTDGDVKKMMQIFKENDGKVDIFSLGGTDLYLYSGPQGKRYTIKESERIISVIKKTITVDRFGMAEGLIEAGCEMTFGDLIFGLNIPIAMHSLKTINVFARLLLPILIYVPIKYLYPTGEKQEKSNLKYVKYFYDADVIAGDYLGISQYMPQDMEGKIVITNTVTSSNVEDLKKRGVSYLIATTPEFEGRSFGTNVFQAVLVAISGKSPEELQAKDYLKLIEKTGFKPRIEKLN